MEKTDKRRDESGRRESRKDGKRRRGRVMNREGGEVG